MHLIARPAFGPQFTVSFALLLLGLSSPMSLLAAGAPDDDLPALPAIPAPATPIAASSATSTTSSWSDLFPTHNRIETQVNTFTASEQAHAALAVAPDGSMVVAWDSRRQERGTYGIFAQRIDPLGRLLGPEVHVNICLPGMQTHPAIALDADGSAWIAWETTGQDGSGLGIVARRFGPGLTSPSAEIPVNLTRDGDQSAPVVAVTGDGRALVVWTSTYDAQTGIGAMRLVGRVLGHDGQPVTGEFAIAESHDGADVTPTIAPLGEDRFVIAWARRDSAGIPAGVWARRFDSAGTPKGDSMMLNESDGLDHVEPAIAGASDGRFVAAWMTQAENGFDVSIRRFSADGKAIDATSAIAFADNGWKSGVAVTLSPDDGRFLVAYNSDGQDGEKDGVFARLFAFSDGGAIGSEFRLNDRTAGAQQLAIASGASRLAWSDADQIAGVWFGDAGGEDTSAAGLSLIAPASLVVPEPTGTDAERVAAEFHDADMLAPNPPVWDPNFVPLPPLGDAGPDGPDFGFEGVPFTGWTPPDPELAVGQSHIVVMTNGQIACFDKAGNNIWRDEIENSFGFWGSLGANNFVFDPEVKWDSLTNRFFAMACERSDNGRSYFLLAVSKDAAPETAADWWKYRLDVTGISDNDIDSPNMAIDNVACYLTADFFGPDKFLVYILNKAALLTGASPATRFLLITGTQSYGVPVTYDSNAPAQYMIQSTEFTNNSTVIFHAITDPLGTPQRQTFTLNVPPYTYPNQPPQRGTTSRPFLFEPRFWSCMYRDGSLWATHHVNSTRARVRWYEFHMNGWPTSGQNPTMVQNGEIDLGGTIHTYFGSIHADAEGNAALTFARSSPDEYISMSRALRASTDPPNTFQAAEIVKESTASHTSGRWGDYSGTQADEFVPRTFWGHHEFTTQLGSWRTWIARYDVPTTFNLSVDATCPGGGAIAVSWAGGTPNGMVGLVIGAATGSFTIPNNSPCPGTVLGVTGGVQLVFTGASNASGAGSVNSTAPAAACGRFMQLVDGATCGTSNVVQVQ